MSKIPPENGDAGTKVVKKRLYCTHPVPYAEFAGQVNPVFSSILLDNLTFVLKLHVIGSVWALRQKVLESRNSFVGRGYK